MPPFNACIPSRNEIAPANPVDRILAAIDTMMAAASSLRASSRSLRRPSERLHEEASQLAEKIPLFVAAEQRLWAERNRSLEIAADAEKTARRIRRIENGEEIVCLRSAA